MKINKLTFGAFAVLASVVVLFASCTVKIERKTEQKPQQLVEVSKPEGVIVERLARIDSAFQRMVDQELMPQAVTMMVHKGQIVHYKAYGWRNIEDSIPCERTDIFRMASQTKAIAVCALMTLWEQGLFQLDEPIKNISLLSKIHKCWKLTTKQLILGLQNQHRATSLSATL